ncbi:MAG: metal-dependent phosphohydrolase [Chitinophagaceae bacterium]|nr:MAG: metal-dependent phosphohydrolase [Chitinophagaceae bacterium]
MHAPGPEGCIDYVTNLFLRYADDRLRYHNLQHTQAVAARAEEMAAFYQLAPGEHTTLCIAAWFHDTGQLTGPPDGHEARSVEQFRGFCRQKPLPPSWIEQVEGCINATRLPQQPENLLQEIICDADTWNLGTPGFATTDRLLQEEMNLRLGHGADRWNENTLTLLEQHRFFTAYAQQRLEQGKQQNIERIRARLKGTR